MTNRRRFRLHILGLVAFTAAATGVFLYFLSLSGVRLTGTNGYTLRAQVPSAIDLTRSADIREAGVKIGTVQGITRQGDHVLVTMSLQSPHILVYRDAQAQIADKSLAGENYVDLDPGTPAAGALPAGATLPLSHDPASVQLDQILSSFDSQRRRDLRRILDVLGPGLGGHGSELNAFLAASEDLVNHSAPVASVLAADRRQLASLIDQFGSITAALGQRADDIRTFVHDIRIAAQAVAARQPQLETTLTQLPGFLGQAQTTVTHLGVFSRSATPVIANLATATETLIPSMYALGPAATATQRVTAGLGRFAQAASPTVSQLRRFAPAAAAMLPAYEATLRQANPLVAYLAPYALDLGSFFSATRAATEVTDATGHYGRLDVGFNQASFAGALSPDQTQALNSLVHSGLLSPVSTLNTNPYPAVRGAENPSPFTGSYPRLQPDPPYSSHHQRRP